ncbi:MAG: hypothetical protein ACKOEE_01730 [Tagaea sp.]
MDAMSRTAKTGMDDRTPRPPEPREQPAGPPTHFEFRHKVFEVPGAVFELDHQTNEPVLKVDLGDLRAAMTFTTLRTSFGLAKDSPDDRMLAEVAKALAFVRSVRPGDTVPAELLDGSASWKVEPRHLATAQGRITASLLAWLGEGADADSAVELAALGADASIRSKVQVAFGLLAARMGLPAVRRGEVVDAVDQLANELSYIESLREQVGHARRTVDLLKRLRVSHKRDRATCENLARIVHLLERPVKSYETRIDEVDAHTGEIQNAIPNLARQVAFVREARDWLHREVMRWSDVLKAWADETAEPSQAQLSKIGATYRFAARNFPLAEEWVQR